MLGTYSPQKLVVFIRIQCNSELLSNLQPTFECPLAPSAERQELAAGCPMRSGLACRAQPLQNVRPTTLANGRS